GRGARTAHAEGLVLGDVARKCLARTTDAIRRAEAKLVVLNTPTQRDGVLEAPERDLDIQRQGGLLLVQRRVETECLRRIRRGRATPRRPERPGVAPGPIDRRSDGGRAPRGRSAR